MSKIARDTLLKTWGYASFRPMQEDIVDAALQGQDCLALLPTGGGKSICFQVPGMAMEGLCLVITPLIALMKDQVQNLKKLNIRAAAIYSGLHPNEVEIIYNQAVFKQLKFLYVSPERLLTDRFVEALKRMKVNLIAVDESHCISQWGYDFRPPYLRIAEIRPLLPDTPVMALTATATPEVVKDIQDKLKFKTYRVFQTSYERKNLTYNIIDEADKFSPLVRLFKAMNKGSGIVYVRNRKRTRDIADFLSTRGISATNYHAGLDANTRDKRQKQWISGSKKVMVATNAFGMGIDKPDVRLVVHMDLPDSLEAYFQEAGRGGRDGEESQAYLICSGQDIAQLKTNFETSFPELKKIKAVYQALGNYFQVPVGSGKDQAFEFDLAEFSNHYSYPILEVYNSLRLLEKEGLIMLNESVHTPSKLFIKSSREDLYRLQVEQPHYDAFLKHLLRSYPGIFTDFVTINENEIARKLNSTSEKIGDTLIRLQKMAYLDYQPRSEKPQLVFSSERIAADDLFLSKENYSDRKTAALERLQAVIDFVHNKNLCRSTQLLAYFGEQHAQRCGKCDVCTRRNELNLTDIEFDNICSQLKQLLQQRPYPLFEAVRSMTGFPEEKIMIAIRWLIDNKLLIKDEDNNLSWNKQPGLNL